MVNVKKAEAITIKIEGEEKERHFKFNARALNILDEEFKSATEVLQQAETKAFSTFHKVLYAGLKQEDEKLDYNYLCDVVPLDVDLMAEVMAATTRTFPQEGNQKNLIANPIYTTAKKKKKRK